MDFSINIQEKDGLRTLHFDSRWTQGGMRVGRPWDLALEYTREMMTCLLMRDESHFPDNVLLIGLGAGSLAKFLYHHYPFTRLTVIEIEPRVVTTARHFFHLPVDPDRLEIVIGDGAEYVRTTGETYDLILVDGFNENAHPGDLNTLPFYQECRARLSDQGLLVVNLLGLCDGVKGGFAHIEAAFDHRAVMFPRCKSGNTIAFAVSSEGVNLSLDELKHRARVLESRTGLALMPTLRKLDDDPSCREGGLAF